MSAFVVSTDHISALLKTALSGPAPGGWSIGGHRHRWFYDGRLVEGGERDVWRELTLENVDQVGRMLLDENVASVGYRYSPPGREAIYGEGWEGDSDANLPGSYVKSSPAPGIEAIEVAEHLIPFHFDYGAALPCLTAVEGLKAINCYEYQSCEHDGWKDSEAHAFCSHLTRSLIGELPGYDAAPWSI